MENDNIIQFGGKTKSALPAPKILSAAIEQNLSECLIIGWDEKGELYFASTTSNLPEVNFLLDKAKLSVFDMMEMED